jgi:hypothetical protein
MLLITKIARIDVCNLVAQILRWDWTKKPVQGYDAAHFPKLEPIKRREIKIELNGVMSLLCSERASGWTP